MEFAQRLILFAIPVIFAITVHEVAHGWVANKLGDPTARMLGRITLNPIKHIDPIGTIAVPALLLYLGGFIFGWAKPVPVTWKNLRHKVRDPILVAVAGPLSNFIMAIFWAFVYKFSQLAPGAVGNNLSVMGQAGIMINIILLVLNLLPIPPLDGSRVVSVLLPGPLSWQYNRLEPYGFFILIALIITGILSAIMMPFVHFFMVFIQSIVNIF